MKFRFYLALWAGKFIDWLLKLKGETRDDMPGSVIFRICPDFLKYVAKPPIVAAATGTNGKSTVTSLIADGLKSLGYRTAFLDWGPNLRSGHCLLMARSVTLFNHTRVDAVVCEADEGSSPYEMSRLQPTHYIVCNICRDSLRRNGHPLYIRDQIQDAISKCPKTKVILNADDPISGLMKVTKPENVRYFAMEKTTDADISNTVLHDFTICPNCHKKVVYQHRHYLQMGHFTCPGCGLSSPVEDFDGTYFDPEARRLTVKEKDGTEYTVSIDSSSVFNAFNYLSVIAFFRWIGVSVDRLVPLIGSLKVPVSREEVVEVDGIKIHTSMCKGQTGSSASVVMRHLSQIPTRKELVLLVNEEYANPKAHETPSWLWDVDYELLANDRLTRILVGGDMSEDYHYRFLMAGIPEEKIAAVPKDSDMLSHLTFDNVDEIYVLHEVDAVTEAKHYQEAIVQKLKEARHEN